MDHGSWCRFHGSWSMVHGAALMMQGLGLRVHGSWFRVQEGVWRRVGLIEAWLSVQNRYGVRVLGHLREAVKHHELACENLALRVTLRHEHDLADQILVQGWG